MEWSPKLRGFVVVVIVYIASVAAEQLRPEPVAATAMTATVEEMPQRPMTLTNGYHPGLFPFNNGQPFVMDSSSAGLMDSITKPPSPPQQQHPQQRSDDYYDYDKMEEVPYDYKGDPIDRKDVVDPHAPRPNDIVKPNNKVDKLTNPYHFFNLPKNYNLTEKFPLISSSYANMKIQGSGGSSSSLSNHRMPSPTSSSSSPLSTVTYTPSTTTPSWYNTVKTTTVTRPTTTSTTTTTTTTNANTVVPPSQEYEEYGDYSDYYHPQEPAPVSESTVKATAATTTTTTSTTSRYIPTVITPEPTTTTAMPATTRAPPSTTTSTTTTTNKSGHNNPIATVVNKTAATATTTRPEIDSKFDGTSFADYDVYKPTDKHHQEYVQGFKPLPANYQFDDKTYPVITNSKVPMTFTAHVSSGISLNQKEHAPDFKPPAATALSEPTHSSSSKPLQSEIQKDTQKRPLNTAYESTKPTAANSQSELSTHSKPKPQKPIENDQPETIYYKVRPESAVPGTNPNRPASQPIQNRPYQPEPSTIKTSQSDIIRKPVNAELPMSQGRPKPYPPIQSDVYTKNKHQYATSQSQPMQFSTPQSQSAQYVPSQSQSSQYAAPQSQPSQYASPQNQPQYIAQHQNKPQYTASVQIQPQYTAPAQSQPQYTAPQSQPDTSKFKPPKHVINHFIKTLPDEDNKSYALQTSFSIGMDGERTADTRPANGIGQVLLVENGSSEALMNQTIPMYEYKSTTSIPLISPQRPIQKPQPNYARPQWETVSKPSPHIQAPKRDGISPPQRPNLPNILPQFRPNAKVDAPPMTPQSHSATIERVQMPMDHLRPPPLPKPQFLKVDRNDDNIDEEILDIPEKETRILQRTGPQPAKVTTLQMIQHGVPTNLHHDDKENPVHVVYASNTPQKSVDKITDDSVMLDVKDRSDVPILKTKTTLNKPMKIDFPYTIIKPNENQNASSMEYKAYSPTKLETIKQNNDRELVPNIQDYVPINTRESSIPNVAIPQKQITATLKTSEDNYNHKMVDEGHKPLLQNFQIPFQPSLKLPENSNGWSVVRKPQIDNVSERADEDSDVSTSTEKFDPENFKPQLVGGFMPINSPTEDTKEKKSESERAK